MQMFLTVIWEVCLERTQPFIINETLQWYMSSSKYFFCDLKHLSQYVFQFWKQSAKIYFGITISCILLIPVYDVSMAILALGKARSHRKSNLDCRFGADRPGWSKAFLKSLHKIWKICLLSHCDWYNDTWQKIS